MSLRFLSKQRVLALVIATASLLAACGGRGDAVPAMSTDAAYASHVAPSTPNAEPMRTTQAATPAATTALADTPTQVVAAAPAPGDPKTAVLNAIHALAQAGPYHTVGTISSNGQSSQLTTDVVPPDRLHYTLSTPDGAMEFIGVGGQGYMKTKGVWRPSPVGGSDMLQSAEPLREDMIAQITDVAFVRTETVNGVAAHVYTYTTHLDDVNSTATLWVSAANGLPIKIEADSQVAGNPARGTQTITYDPHITINAPIK